MKTSAPTKSRTRVRSHESEIIGNVIIKPRRMAKLMVGMYENTMPVPTFHVRVEPAGADAINASLLKFDGDDHYTLVYHFQNYTDSTYRVIVENND